MSETSETVLALGLLVAGVVSLFVMFEGWSWL